MFEIELPLEKGGVSYVNSDHSQIKPNMIICAKPGQIRHTKLPFKCYYIHIILKDGDLKDLLMRLPTFIQTNQYKKYYEIFEKLCEYYQNVVDLDEIIMQSLILELIHTLANEAQKLTQSNRIKTNNYKAIEETITYIQENLTADLSLESLASKAGFSPVHYHNIFKASTGRTIREYVEEQRIKKAANLLITTDHTLSEIAYECGFSSQSYFSYAFKRKMNKTPRKYATEIFERYE
jgi:AraC-like DNA-binding protein